ncbi:MAG: hypothetical protein KJO85_01405, partial [Gammaproteobacteria bacterium]|nr:hypothetical protein [Gammaproteobacteria bacterium]
MKLKRLIVIAALMLSLVGQGAFAASKGLEHYFKKPQYAGFQISPNGEEMAALVPVEGRMNIVIIDLETNQPRIVTGETSQDVNGFMWASNERLLYFMDKDGSESFGIFAVNADGSKWRMLVEPAALRIANGAAVIRFNQVIDRLKDDPEHVLVSSNQRRAEFPDVYRLNIFNGRKRMVQRNTGNVQGWFVDYDSEIVGAGYS